MTDYTYQGATDIDRAIGYFVELDAAQTNALAVLQVDSVLEELQLEYTKATADASYRPSDDFIARLSGYLEMADDRENPSLT
ncbi:MAG: hypothetical protein JWP75_1913 [Frondihabitans sp.]|nr:hypothetical protein [Frondihabitans sp.]